MLPLSSDAKARIEEGVGYFVQEITATLLDGTILRITNEDILGDMGIEIEDATSSQGTLDIGSAIINSLAFTMMNFDDQLSRFDFNNARLSVRVGIPIDEETIEYLRKGVFTVTESHYSETSIRITAYDNMHLFDQEYSLSTLAYPATLADIVDDACTVCGVPNEARTFQNSTMAIPTKPDSEGLTFREVISWCAQIAGCYARIDNTGALTFGWYDLETIGNDESENFHEITGIYSRKIGTEDTVVTGIKAVVKAATNGDPDVTYMYGKDGYVIELAGNGFITSTNAQSIVDSIGRKIVGMWFRQIEVTHLADPSFEAGDIMRIASNAALDVLMVNDSGLQVNDEYLLLSRKAIYYWGIVSYTKFTAGSSQNTRSDSQEIQANSAARYTQISKVEIEARQEIKKEQTAREQAIQNLNDRINNASGMYVTTQPAPGGGSIYYMHNKPNLSDSDIIWKYTAEAFAVSTDGGQTYPYGIDMGGNAILNKIYAEGIDANYITTGSLDADRIAAHSISVGKLTGTISNAAGWSIDLDNGIISVGELSANKITSGYINTDRIQANTIDVSKLTGKINDGFWEIDFENGTMTIGDISASNITAGTITGAITATNLTMTGGTLQVTANSTQDMFINLNAPGGAYTRVYPTTINLHDTGMSGLLDSHVTISPLDGLYIRGKANQYGSVRVTNSDPSGAFQVMQSSDGETYTETAKINMDGSAEFTSVEVGGNDIITYINNAVADALQEAKDYADSLIS